MGLPRVSAWLMSCTNLSDWRYLGVMQHITRPADLMLLYTAVCKLSAASVNEALRVPCLAPRAGWAVPGPRTGLPSAAVLVSAQLLKPLVSRMLCSCSTLVCTSQWWLMKMLCVAAAPSIQDSCPPPANQTHLTAALSAWHGIAFKFRYVMHINFKPGL